jgi:DNA mismatch repair protein MSH3
MDRCFSLFLDFEICVDRPIPPKCTSKELSVLLPAFNKVALAYEAVDNPDSVGLKSSLLNEIISSLPRLRQPMKELLGAVNLRKAAEGQKDSMWTDTEKYPEIIDADMVCGPLRNNRGF